MTITRRSFFALGAAGAAAVALPKSAAADLPPDFTYIDANCCMMLDKPSQEALFAWIADHGHDHMDTRAIAVRGNVAKFWASRPPARVERNRLVRPLPKLTSTRTSQVTTIREQITNQAANANLIADLIRRALEQLRREIDMIDGYGSGDTDGGHAKGTISNPTLGAVQRREGLDQRRAALVTYLQTRELIDGDVLALLRPFMERIPPKRCSGAIDATCTNAASDHHDPVTGATTSDLCDRCWLIACRKCHHRSQEPYRDGKCGACSRADYRDRDRMSA